MAWTTKPLVYREGKTLVVRPLKKTLFLCVSPLTRQSLISFGYELHYLLLSQTSNVNFLYLWGFTGLI